MSSAPRRSLGGAVVENSLRSAGFDVAGEHCALVETQRPVREPFAAVLAQNAWNVLPPADFRRLAAPYPARMVARMRLRRVVAHLNLRRTGRVVCLSEAMAELVRGAGVPAQRVVVAPAYVALDMAEERGATSPPDGERSVLVPGTVTWYKNPAAALPIALERGVDVVRFAGPDDGSGCWADVEVQARRLGVRVSRETLGRDAMREALAAAELVVLPSRLESLGFSLGEALSHARDVAASPLPAHVEAAGWAGGSLTWLPDDQGQAVATPAPASPATREPSVEACWIAVGEALGLRR